MPSTAARRPRQPRAQPAAHTGGGKRDSGPGRSRLPDHAACWFSAAWASVTPERVRVAAAASKTNARWLLGRLSVFLFVLELDGAVGSKHHTGLLEVGLEEDRRRLLGA